MAHSFLAIPVNIIPEWTKQNVPTYGMGYFSNDNQFMLIDNAHTDVTYARWLGPNFDQLPNIIANSTELAYEQLLQLQNDSDSIWYVVPGAE